MRLATRLLLMSAAVLTAGACGTNARGSAQALVSTRADDPAESGTCTLRETKRDSLVMAGGRHLYVSPEAIATNKDGDVLLAGARNVLLARAPSGVWDLVDADSIFGVVLRRDVPPQIVRSPIPNRLVDAVRVVTHEDGTWSVAFAEVTPITGAMRGVKSDSAARLWHGRLSGARWVEVDSLPTPSTGVVDPDNASPLIRYGDTLAWAVVMRLPDNQKRTVVLERRQGGWAHETVTTRFASYPALAYSPRSGLLLAVVDSDLDQIEDGGNTLFFWARRPAWERIRKVVPSSVEQVHHPLVSFAGPSDGVVTWQTDRPAHGGQRMEVRIMSGDIERATQPARTLDLSAFLMSPVARLEMQRGWLWGVDHLDPITHDRRFRLVDAHGRLLASTEHPFVSGVGVVAMGPSDLLLSGGKYDPVERRIVTLLIRFKLECPAVSDQPA